MMRPRIVLECDHCGVVKTFDTHDGMAAERAAEKIGWKVPRLTLYGGYGHYCRKEQCQEQSAVVEYLQQ